MIFEFENKRICERLVELKSSLDSAIEAVEVLNDVEEVSNDPSFFKDTAVKRNTLVKEGYEYFYNALSSIYTKSDIKYCLPIIYKHIDRIQPIKLNFYNEELIKQYKTSIKNYKLSKFSLTKDLFSKGMMMQLDEPYIDGDYEKYEYGYFDNDTEIVQLVEDDIVWMSLLPNEIITMNKDKNKLFGNVLCAGLGMAYFPLLLTRKDSIKEIDVIELDNNIIKIYEESIKGRVGGTEKINIINGNAITYINKYAKEKYDSIYIDIWHDVNDGIPLYLYFKSHEIKNIKYVYWIERSMLIYFRRFLITFIYEKYFKYDVKEDEDSLEQRIFNYIERALSTTSINNTEQIDDLIKLENIEKLIKNNKFELNDN